MQSENRFFDDFAKMVNGIAGTVAGAGREAEALKARLDKLEGAPKPKAAPKAAAKPVSAKPAAKPAARLAAKPKAK